VVVKSLTTDLSMENDLIQSNICSIRKKSQSSSE